MIVQEILLARAAIAEGRVPQSELDTAYDNAKKNLADEAYQQELTRRNLTAADMKEGLRREMLTQKVIEQEVGSKIAVSDKEINDFFAANRAQFNVAEESYRIAQIVITPVRDPQISNGTGDDAATPQAAVAKVKMLMERLKAGASFRDLAGRLFGGSRVRSSRRRPGVPAGVAAQAGAAGAARRGVEQGAWQRQRGDARAAPTRSCWSSRTSRPVSATCRRRA